MSPDAARITEPMYYDESIFNGLWSFGSRGWSPAEGEDLQRTPMNDTTVNCFHMSVRDPPYSVDLRDGPYTQEVRVWRGGVLFSGAEESTTIRTPQYPYVCFVAVSKDPEAFL